MAPAHSLARLRKHVLDRVARGEITMVEAARQIGCSRSRLYELRECYHRYGEAGLFPQPRPTDRIRPRSVRRCGIRSCQRGGASDRGPRSIGWQLAKPRFGGWKVSVDGACNFGFARVHGGEKTAAAMARFLEHDIAPVYREAGIPLREVVTDGGPEFVGRCYTDADHIDADLQAWLRYDNVERPHHGYHTPRQRPNLSESILGRTV